MFKGEARRLVGYRDFVSSWRKAARHAECGRTDRAAALFARTMRTARALGSQPARRAALERLTAPLGIRMGPAQTPSIAPVRARRSPRLLLRTPCDRMRVERRSIEGLNHSTGFQLLVDATRQRVFVDGKDLPLEGRDTPLGILAALIRAGGGPLTLDELFPKVWGRNFNPAYDANTVYFHISRLRKFLDQLAPGLSILTTTPEGYMLAPGLRYALIEAEKPRQQVGRDRDRVLGLLADRRFVDNRSYCEITGVSRSTALRELADLVTCGVLLREGAGRGVRYRVASPDPAALAALCASLPEAPPPLAAGPAPSAPHSRLTASQDPHPEAEGEAPSPLS